MKAKFRDLSIMIDLASTDAALYKGFIKQEIGYYNSLVEGLNSRVRSCPELLVSLHKDWVSLWETLAESGMSLKPYFNDSSEPVLPNHLQPHRRMILGKNSQGNRFLSEKLLYLLDLPAKPARIDPQVKKSMARVLLDFYKLQAAKALRKDVYSGPIKLLSKYDTNRQCLQIPRKTLTKVEYVKESDLTYLYTSYSKNPIVIKGYDLESDHRWNLIFLRYVFGTENTEKETWFVDIKHSKVPYWIKDQRVKSPRSGCILVSMKEENF